MPVNYPAVLVAAVVSFVLGAAWYSPWLFAKAWSTSPGRNADEVKKQSITWTYLVGFAADLVLAFVFAVVVQGLGIRGIISGMQAGFFAWLGFIATTGLKTYMYAGHPRKLYIIDFGYHLVSLVFMGALLASWPPAPAP